MGSNNSGKSTAATAIYAACKAATSVRGMEGQARARAFSFFAARQSLSEYSEIEMTAVREALDKVDRGRYQDALIELASVISEVVLRAFAKQFVEELEKGLGVPIADLATRSPSGRRLPLRIIFSEASWSVEVRLRGNSVNISAQVTSPPDLPTESSVSQFFGSSYQLDETDVGLFLSLAGQDCARAILASFPARAHYLPAARAGLLQSHRLVAAALVQRSPRVGIGEVSMPALSGVVADFISEILLNDTAVRSSRKGLQTVARQIQRSVMKGEVRQVTTDGGYPDIDFHDVSGSYPIHRTSSMVSELAPIVLLLNRTVQLGDLLIIEEPESHLHPAAQVDLSRILFHACRSIQLLITTHSDFVLSEFNNQLRRQSLTDHSDRDVSSSAYFMYRRHDVGCDIRRLEVTAIDGIPEDSFAEVATDLYNEQVSQQERLMDGTHEH